MEAVSIRTRHNIIVLSPNKQLGANNSVVSKSLEKLSSGSRINRAGDDAAGLVISGKMRAQIKGLEAVTDNSQDAIFLVQTAEGGLQEVHPMLDYVTELATKSANGTYMDDVDCKALQDEVSALKDEINHIADGTDFNGIKLLDGTMGVETTGVNGRVGSTAGKVDASNVTVLGVGENTSVDLETAVGATTGAKVEWLGGKLTVTITGVSANDKIAREQINQALASVTGTPETAENIKIELDGDVNINAKTTINGIATLITVKAVQAASADTGASSMSISSAKAGANTHALATKTAGIIGVVVDVDGNVALGLTSTESYTATEINKTLSDAGSDIGMGFEGSKTGIEASDIRSRIAANVLKLGENGKTGASLVAGGDMKFQIGDTNDSYDQLELSIVDIHVNAFDLDSVNISTRGGTSVTMGKTKTVINTVSTNHDELDAIQSRPERTTNNLGIITENITSTKSRIRGVDMVKEIVDYTRNSVLVQSAQAIFAQVNQQLQSVLQLLQ